MCYHSLSDSTETLVHEDAEEKNKKKWSPGPAFLISLVTSSRT